MENTNVLTGAKGIGFKVLMTFQIFFLCSLGSAQTPTSSEKKSRKDIRIEWLTFEEAIQRSEKEPRPIFIDVYTSWCGWCKKMDKTTFDDPAVAKYMSENYYCIKFDAEGKEEVVFPHKTYINSGRNHDLAVELLDGKMTYPSVVYLDKRFAKIQAIPGYRGADEFLMISTFFGEEAYKNTTWEAFSENYSKPNLK